MAKKLIVFNWKMNPASLKEAEKLIAVYKKIKLKNIELVVAPPDIFLEHLSASAAAKGYDGLRLASQDIFYKNKGAYTGEISPKMLKNLGVEYAIIGHSERRNILGETDAVINKKVLAALKAGLKVILCVGELKRESKIQNYESRLKKAKDYVKKQLGKDLKNIYNSLFKIHNSLIIAYEPVWAIGTGKNDTPEDAAEMIKFIRHTLDLKFKIQNSKLLYGGSVNGQNIKNFLKYKEIDGALIGGASVNPKEIRNLIKKLN